MKKTWMLFEGRPALHVDGEAWCFGRDRRWTRIHSAVAMCEGIVSSERTGKVTRRKIGVWFGAIPRLPREAFSV